MEILEKKIICKLFRLRYSASLISLGFRSGNEFKRMKVTTFSITDNPPVFDRPNYETQITEEDDRNLPKRVLQVYKNTFLRFPELIPFADPFSRAFHLAND